MFRSLMILLCAAACEPKEVIPDRTDTDSSTGSECGAPVNGLTLTFVGVVQDSAGKAVKNATLALEDRSIPPADELGTAKSAADGTFTLVASDITDLPGCWLTALDYTLVVEATAGSVERFVNREMYTALHDGVDTVDLTSRPLVIEP